MDNEDTCTSKIGLILGSVVGWWGLLYVVFMAVTKKFTLEESWTGPFIWLSIDILLATVSEEVRRLSSAHDPAWRRILLLRHHVP